MFSDVLFNKIIGRKSKISIDRNPTPPTTEYYGVYYKDKQVGAFTLYNPGLTTYRFNLIIFGQKYISDPLPLFGSQDNMRVLLVNFLSKLGLSLDGR